MKDGFCPRKAARVCRNGQLISSQLATLRYWVTIIQQSLLGLLSLLICQLRGTMTPRPVLQLFAKGCPFTNLIPRLLAMMIIATRLSTAIPESLRHFPNSTTFPRSTAFPGADRRS